ncbi:SDR family NAD(P)-dependent oxidoreductase [Spirillospora sp. NPDC047279]|uniref:SDR family NAD(P)-dependent oxidoreductase n=1 Tax=Spirillospora sp. NPDC047279 TaxID=3155478 RepID=UPI0034115769
MGRVVVTGASGGIGEAIVRRLAADSSVVMVGRDDGRLRAAAERVRSAVPHADLTLERADLALMADVRALAARLPPVDALISNAAVMARLDDVTSEGIQRTLATNHLAPYLLMRLMAGRASRFVVVGADPGGLARVPVDVDDLGSVRGLGPVPSVRPFVLYGRTKNMNAMFVYALARRLDGSATVNGAHPGIIKGTGLGRETRGALKAFKILLEAGPRLKGPDAGADTPAWLAASDEVEGVTGRFFVGRTQVDTAPHTTDAARCDRLWEESARLAGLAP